jgi:uncharacterized protein (TIGR02001 family)
MGTKIKAISLFVCAAALLAWPGGVRADSLIPDDAIPGEFGGYVGFGTEYNWRGISQSDEEASVQGEIDYSVGVSDAITFYVSVWGSNVDFGNDGSDLGDATLEIDYFGGFSGEIPGAPGLGWDIGGIGYTYPGVADEADFDFAEAYGGLSYDFGVASALAYVHYTPEFFGNTGDAVYFFGDVGIPLPKGLTLGGHVGRFEFDDNTAVALPDYTDWKISLTVALLGFDLEFAYIDTDISDTECGSSVCNERFYFFASRSF